ncbi:MAG: GGDEF domain-containing protein [Proteobacteria bacterium]|nr:GGDEF domain-containing protein [Pseudomonadota bacterium]MBU4462777.1 GGDEF domain-containing protein [Pseudomonadota bacterium]
MLKFLIFFILSKLSRYKHPLSLLFLDIDHFKKYNDAYGHI